MKLGDLRKQGFEQCGAHWFFNTRTFESPTYGYVNIWRSRAKGHIGKIALSPGYRVDEYPINYFDSVDAALVAAKLRGWIP